MTPAVADGLLFDGTTHCAEVLPLDWIIGAPTQPEVLQERNAAVLRVLARLEEHPGAHEHADDKAHHDGELPRLEAKLDLVLEMVGLVLALHRPPPPTFALRLSARGLVWSGAPVLETGDRGRVLLHLHPAVPQPLELGAEVVAVDESAPRRAWLRFDTLPEVLATELERYTFRRHRRAVAGLRMTRDAATH